MGLSARAAMNRLRRLDKCYKVMRHTTRVYLRYVRHQVAAGLASGSPSSQLAFRASSAEVCGSMDYELVRVKVLLLLLTNYIQTPCASTLGLIGVPPTPTVWSDSLSAQLFAKGTCQQMFFVHKPLKYQQMLFSRPPLVGKAMSFIQRLPMGRAIVSTLRLMMC